MLELQNVTYTVTENNIEKNIIDHMDLVIPDGKFVVITGPNGGGKSTLAKTIMGINHISSGHLFFDGEDKALKAQAYANERPFEEVKAESQMQAQLAELLTLDHETWKQELEGIKTWYAKFDHMPQELTDALARLEREL